MFDFDHLMLLSLPFISVDEDESARERDQLRDERSRERQRERRIARAHPEKR